MNPSRVVWTTALLALFLSVFTLFTERFLPSAQLVNLKGRDVFFQLRHRLFPKPPAADRIVLVVLDDETLQHLPARWPYPRSFYAQALDRLKPFSPKVIGFDLVFSGNDFSAESDQAFAKALEEAGNVVIASHQSQGGEVGPSPLIRQSAWRVGLVDKLRDRDRLIRRAYLTRAFQDKEYSSWELALFEKVSGVNSIFEPRTASGKAIPINYRLRFKEFPQIPFWKLLEGDVLDREVRDKIILVGLTSETFHDIHATPLGSMPGLSVNANMLLMLMERDFLSFVPFWARAVLSFLALWLTLLVSVSGALVTGVAAVFFLIITYLATSFLLFSTNVVLDLWFVAIVLALTLIGALIFREAQLFFENLRLREESARDPLTGFYSRRFLELKLKSELSRLFLKRGGLKAVHEVSVVMIDLDNFKLVNDSFGHGEGDRVLRTMAAAIRSSVRKDELICRYGGDEFCVILTNITIQDAAKFAEKLRQLIVQNPDLAYRTASGVDTIRVTGSFGVASVQGVKATEPDKLLKAADRALYRAKKGGRNQVCVFDPERDVLE